MSAYHGTVTSATAWGRDYNGVVLDLQKPVHRVLLSGASLQLLFAPRLTASWLSSVSGFPSARPRHSSALSLSDRCRPC